MSHALWTVAGAALCAYVAAQALTAAERMEFMLEYPCINQCNQKGECISIRQDEEEKIDVQTRIDLRAYFAEGLDGNFTGATDTSIGSGCACFCGPEVNGTGVTWKDRATGYGNSPALSFSVYLSKRSSFDRQLLSKHGLLF